MKICHITHGRVNPDGENGITRTVYNLNKYLNNNGVESKILSFNDNTTSMEEFKRDEYTDILLFPRSKFFKNKEFETYILSDNFDYDVVHFHLMWMIDKNTILKALKKKNIPYIITTHAAYTPDRIDSIKKKLAMKSIEFDYLNGAKSLHALCNEEKVFLKELNLNCPIFTIPNGISDIEVEKINHAKKLENPYNTNDINIVWVGRIRKDKNIMGILKSLLLIDSTTRNKIKIHIVGNGIEAYIKEVNAFVDTNDLSNIVKFHGPKFKEEKYQYILNANIYLQPSFSEGISFSILDAMACSKASILSRQTNMTYYYNERFFLMTEPYPEDIANAIIKLTNDLDLQQEMSINARRLIDQDLNWKNLINAYIDMYEKVKN
jgi:poly(glycerol-phosphate) alpha-glucosyltransferase